MKKSVYLLLLFVFSYSNFLSAQKETVVTKKQDFSVGESYFGKVKASNLNEINTKDLEMCPMPFPGGLIFTATANKKRGNEKTNSPKKKYTDLYFTQQTTDGHYMRPMPLAGKVNGDLHDGMACFTKDGKTMYFTRNNKNGKAEDGVVDLKICQAELLNGEWTNVKDLSFNSKAFSNCHPTLSADNQKMFFSSNRRGGFGGMDLYVSELKNGKWQAPINMGKAINTAKNEIFPFFGPDGNLYFSSNGHKGSGGLDIFLAFGPEASDWGAVRNLGQPFNSPSDDFGFITDAAGRTGFFTSSRAGGNGQDDIYSWLLIEETMMASTKSNFNKTHSNDLNTNDMESLANLVREEEDFFLSGREEEQEDESFFGLEGDLVAANSNARFGGNEQYYAEQREKELKKLTLRENSSLSNEIEARFSSAPGQDFWEKARLGVDADVNSNANASSNSTIDAPYSRADVDGVNSNARYYRENRNGVDGKALVNGNGAVRTAAQVQPEQSKTLAELMGLLNETTITEATKAKRFVYTPIPVTHIDEETILNSTSLADPLAVGQIYRLENIYYDFDLANLRKESLAELDKVVYLLQQNPGMQITILSHTDSRGNSDYNFLLSQKRAEAVLAYLVSRNISRDQLKARGYGENKPINSCFDGIVCTDDEHAMNRRTEFQIDHRGPSSYGLIGTPVHIGGEKQQLYTWRK